MSKYGTGYWESDATLAVTVGDFTEAERVLGLMSLPELKRFKIAVSELQFLIEDIISWREDAEKDTKE